MEEAFRSLTYAPTYMPLHIQIGEILVNEGRIPEAIEKFTQVSRLYTIRGDTSQAIRVLNKITTLAPMDIESRHRMIHLLKATGRNEDVIQQYIDLANAHYLLADLEKSRDAYHSALKIARQSVSTRDWSVKILNRLADVELQSLNWKEAVRVFEQLRSLQPLEAAPRTALIDLYFKLRLPQPALNEVDAYIKLLESGGKSGEIESFLDRLVIDNPQDIELHKRLASTYAKLIDRETAVKKLDALAEKLLVEKKKDEALGVIALIIELDPPNRTDYETLYNNLNK
jgi:tetratricopeptide (TPR) repeat protein